MRTTIYFILIMILTLPLMTIGATAHSPQDMQLAYDLETQNLDISITHIVTDPGNHYIYQIDIEKNDVLLLSEQYSSQPTVSTFTYNYTVNASVGDVLTVTGLCSITGSIQQTLSITNETENKAPKTPAIEGPTQGTTGISYEYLFSTADPDEDQIRYLIDWGDGTNVTTAFYPSNEEVTIDHIWNDEGSYIIKAKAEDINGLASSERTYDIFMPKTKKPLSFLSFLTQWRHYYLTNQMGLDYLFIL